MTDKQIIADDLSCDNCPEAQRCQEQRAKKEYAINQVLQDVPSEYANVIDRLKQIIPSITRCDYVLEKQLKRKEQEYERLKEDRERWKSNFEGMVGSIEELSHQLDQLKAENDLYKNAHKTEQDRRRSYENALAEIKEIAKIEYPKSLFTETFVEVINHCPYFDCGNCKCLENKEKQNCSGFICSRKQSVYYQENTIYFKQILQKISEVLKND